MYRVHFVIFLLLVYGCTDQNELQYEPIFLNQTNVDVLLFWEEPGIRDLDSVLINSGDSAYCKSGYFPTLQKSGLRWSDKSSLYDVKLVFETNPRKCLLFAGNQVLNDDIRTFSSYENIGECDFCAIREMSAPDGMLYRITEEHLKRATDCDALEDPSAK